MSLALLDYLRIGFVESDGSDASLFCSSTFKILIFVATILCRLEQSVVNDLNHAQVTGVLHANLVRFALKTHVKQYDILIHLQMQCDV